MKHGTDICEKRRKIFNIITSDYDYINIVHMTNDIRCIITFVDHEFDAMLGFSQNGEWVFKDKDALHILKEKKMFLYCAKLIEVPYETIKRCIHDNFNEIVSMENITISDMFPFYEIVEFIFGNFFDDYWLDLAWLWYMQLNLSEQEQLVDTLVNISKVKRISQRNRQKIKREIERVKRITSRN